MRRICLLLLMALTLSSCYKTEYSMPMNEKGQVLDLFMTPEQVVHNNYSSTDEDGYTSHRSYTNRVPAKYSVIFQCEHGTRFVITGEDALHQELYRRMTRNMNVAISYREVYHVDNKTGEKILADYDFLNATAASEKAEQQ